MLSTCFFHFVINLNRIQSPWTRRQHVPPKHWNKLTNLHGVIIRNSVIWGYSSFLSVFTQLSHSLRVDQMGIKHLFPSTLASPGRLWTPASLLSSRCRTHSSRWMLKLSSAISSKIWKAWCSNSTSSIHICGVLFRPLWNIPFCKLSYITHLSNYTN